MESSKKQVGLSSSPTEDLSGPKDNSSQPSYSPGIFSLIFPPPSAVARKPPSSDLMESLDKQLYVQAWKKGRPDGMANSVEWGTIFQDRPEPSPLSSSIYYGSQEDMYIKSTATHSLPKKKEYDPKENNSHSVLGGNWWDGSVYY